MSWIKLDGNTPDKPEVIRVAKMLKLDRDCVLGKLLRLWLWFDAVSVDGRVDGVSLDDIDTLLKCPGMCAALCEVGWLSEDAEQLAVFVPKFTRHNGDSLKKRLLKNERQARWRANNVDGHVDGHVDTPPSTSASTREEKRREEGKPPSVVKTSRTATSHSERESRASRLALDWKLPDEWRSWTLQAMPQWPEGQVNLEGAKFHDYWIAKAGKDGAKLDWFATWRNWIRRGLAAPPTPRSAPRPKFAD